MRSFRWLILMCVIVFVAAACRSQQEPQQRPAAEGPVMFGPIRDVMHMVVEPSAQVIFDSVAVTVTEKGTQERQPQTEEDWDAVLHAAMTLAEATNLVAMPGRRVSRPEDEKTSAGEGELPPIEIQARIEANRASWLKHVKQLQEVAMKAYQAALDKNVQALWDVGEPIDQACETCHLEFWYPDEKRPEPPK
ncbi:MAG: hypothetical protein HYU37_18295 [Acidobacteria bacterium]|nr:hypothetical protein [Acidobacteriota bacterium]